MAHIDPLLVRNQHFATTAARQGAKITSMHPVHVIDAAATSEGR